MYPGGIAGCVARFPFSISDGPSNILTDISGNANHGKPYGITNASGWQGKANTAGRFNGTSNFGSVPFAGNLNLTNLTQVALIKFDSFYSGECQTSMILSRGDGFGSGVYTMNVSDAGYDNNCYSYSPTHQMRGDYVGNNYGNMVTPATTPIQTGKWYFFAGTFDGSTYKAYQIVMDSTVPLTILSPSYQATGLNAMGTGSDSLMIGAGVNPRYPYWFNGVMDEIVLFNRALAATELQKIYTYLLKSPASTAGIETAIQTKLECNLQAGYLHVRSAGNRPIGQLMITNMQDQVLLVTSANIQEVNVDVSSYPKGLLFVTAKCGGESVSVKVTNL